MPGIWYIDTIRNTTAMIGVKTSAKYLFLGVSNLSILNKICFSFLYQIMFISLLISS